MLSLSSGYIFMPQLTHSPKLLLMLWENWNYTYTFSHSILKEVSLPPLGREEKVTARPGNISCTALKVGHSMPRPASKPTLRPTLKITLLHSGCWETLNRYRRCKDTLTNCRLEGFGLNKLINCNRKSGLTSSRKGKMLPNFFVCHFSAPVF